LLPIHNGTFDLSMHSWREPFDRMAALGNVRGIPVIIPLMGEPVSMHDTAGGRHWWEGSNAKQPAPEVPAPAPAVERFKKNLE